MYTNSTVHHFDAIQKVVSKITIQMILATFVISVFSVAKAETNAELLNLFEPNVEYENETLTNGRTAVTETTIKWQVKNSTTTFGVVTVSVNSNSSVSAFLNPYVAGRFKFGIKTKGTLVRKLAPGSPHLTEGTTRVRYPYDWAKTFTPNSTSPVEMIIPGLAIDGRVIAHDDDSLFEIALQQNEDKTWEATYFKQREVNTGFDRTVNTYSLDVNEVVRLDLIVTNSVKNSQRLARDIASTPIDGHVTQLAFRGWGSTEKGIYPDLSEFEQVARKYKNSGVKHVILRLNEPKPEIARIFKRYGVTPHYYMFLGVSRVREKADGTKCYSFVISGQLRCVSGMVSRESNGDIYTPQNKAWAYLELRDEENRKFLTTFAVSAIKNGYDGIFFDGPQLWTGNDGRIGGAYAGATMSWYKARALLLAETVEAVKRASPNANVGILGNDYMDYQSVTDYIVKEVANWVSYKDADPTKRVLNYKPEYLGPIKHDYGYYVPQFYLGAKGNNANSVKQMHEWAKQQGTPGFAYLEFGDFGKDYMQSYADIIRIISNNMLGP